MSRMDSFPNGIPNPLLPENRAATADAVMAHKADMGIAWDGDFDRCFLFDEQRPVHRRLLHRRAAGARPSLAKHPGAKIIHDPRLTWNTIDRRDAMRAASRCSPRPGHAFIKERMRQRRRAFMAAR